MYIINIILIFCYNVNLMQKTCDMSWSHFTTISKNTKKREQKVSFMSIKIFCTLKLFFKTMNHFQVTKHILFIYINISFVTWKHLSA